jgi:hypothetical protein
MRVQMLRGCERQGASMRVRLRFDPNEIWIVEGKHWYNFNWHYENSFMGDNAYERAHFYARALRHPHIEEIT